MKFHIATKLAFVLIAVGMIAAAITGLFVYDISRNLLVESAKNRLLSSTQALARRLLAARQETVRDLQTIAGHPLSEQVLSSTNPQVREQLVIFLRLIMETHPTYEQIRLISAEGDGLELLRFDRMNHTLQQIVADDLQKKGHYSYVSETLKQPARTAYMSRISSRQEPGSDVAWGKPTMHLAMPVVSALGKALGVVVITMNISHTFSTLVEDLPADFELYLANGSGDLLIHPDRQRTYGADTGRHLLIQEEFPPHADAAGGEERQSAVRNRPQRRNPADGCSIRQATNRNCLGG